MGQEKERERTWKENWPNVADTSEFIDRVADRVGKRIPGWVYKAGFSALASIVIGCLLAVDYMRMQAVDGRFQGVIEAASNKYETLLAHCNNRFLAHEARIAEGERIRIERLKQLDEHEKLIAVNTTKLKTIEDGIASALDQLRKSIDRLEGKVDKLKDKP
jgi:hypothetical protein